MLKYFTKKSFMEAVDQRKFLVSNVKGNTFQVNYIGHDDISNQFSVRRVINPDSKDGNFRKNGGGYNKFHATLEDVASYVDANAEDKDIVDSSCLSYLQHKQWWNEL